MLTRELPILFCSTLKLKDSCGIFQSFGPKKPMKNQEILESLPNCMREIFQYYFETFRIHRLCDAFEFNFKIK